MNGPKLYNTSLCRFLIFFPYVLFITSFFVLDAIDIDVRLEVLIFLACICYVIIYSICNFFPIVASFTIFPTITAWKNTRTFYKSIVNGKSKEEITERILNRCERYGYRFDGVKGKLKPSGLFCGIHRAIHFEISHYEKYSIVYSVSHLDKALYNDILSSARSNAESLHSPHLKKEGKRIAKAVALIIIADSVDEGAIAVTYSQSGMSNNCFLPCIIDISEQKYYVNTICAGCGYICKKALKHTKAVVFNNRLKLTYNDEMIPYPDKDYTPDMTFKEFKKECNIGFIPNKQTRTAKKLRDGEVAYVDDHIICKIKKRFAIFPAKMGDDEVLTVIIKPKWSGADAGMISIAEFDRMKSLIEGYLKENQYNYIIITEEIFRGRKKKAHK